MWLTTYFSTASFCLLDHEFAGTLDPRSYSQSRRSNVISSHNSMQVSLFVNFIDEMRRQLHDRMGNSLMSECPNAKHLYVFICCETHCKDLYSFLPMSDFPFLRLIWKGLGMSFILQSRPNILVRVKSEFGTAAVFVTFKPC